MRLLPFFINYLSYCTSWLIFRFLRNNGRIKSGLGVLYWWTFKKKINAQWLPHRHMRQKRGKWLVKRKSRKIATECFIGFDLQVKTASMWMCLSKESEWGCHMGIHAFVVLDRKVGINFQVPKYVAFCFSILFWVNLSWNYCLQSSWDSFTDKISYSLKQLAYSQCLQPWDRLFSRWDRKSVV